MKIVIFGLVISSSWGNGHATIWRGLWRALVHRGHTITFFEKDVSYYAAHRDLTSLPGGEIAFYPDWDSVLPRARRELADADVALVTSYCPDGIAAAHLILDSPAKLKCFYDLDTPVTLDLLRSDHTVSYLPPEGLGGFDLVFSYTGGRALDGLKAELGARRVAPLYGSVDPDLHFPVPLVARYDSQLSYLGTYAEDRQEMLFRLFIEPARHLPEKRFLIGGAQYPESFPWRENIFFVRHLPPSEHPSFYCSSRMTLNVTRRAMTEMGYCPSGRLFEAAACGVPIVSDFWEGLDHFFEPFEEILIVRNTEEVVQAMLHEPDLAKIGRRARERTLVEHTAAQRALEFEQALDRTWTEKASAHDLCDEKSETPFLMEV